MGTEWGLRSLALNQVFIEITYDKFGFLNLTAMIACSGTAGLNAIPLSRTGDQKCQCNG
jgi:hypothetical protein